MLYAAHTAARARLPSLDTLLALTHTLHGGKSRANLFFEFIFKRFKRSKTTICLRHLVRGFSVEREKESETESLNRLPGQIRTKEDRTTTTHTQKVANGKKYLTTQKSLFFRYCMYIFLNGLRFSE